MSDKELLQETRSMQEDPFVIEAKKLWYRTFQLFVFNGIIGGWAISTFTGAKDMAWARANPRKFKIFCIGAGLLTGINLGMFYVSKKLTKLNDESEGKVNLNARLVREVYMRGMGYRNLESDGISRACPFGKSNEGKQIENNRKLGESGSSNESSSVVPIEPNE